ncbi:MAG: hypothetical protein H0T73_20350 [Ardenticatenales bacterium]|nr:hypothetical protein [Ardenticatenales bacterium]
MGQVLPMTSGGLEYFVDVMVELAVRIEGFKQVRVARVIKTNSADFPIGLEMKDPTFSDFLNRLGEGPQPERVEVVPEVLEEVVLNEDPSLPTLEELLAKAEAFGLGLSEVTTAARHYHGTSDLERLTPTQIDDLYERLMARYSAPVQEEVVELEMLTNGNGNGHERPRGRRKVS